MSVDVSLLRQFSSETFIALLKQIPGDKDLIIQSSLMKPLDKFTGMSLLKNSGVKKVFKIEQSEIFSTNPSRVFLIESSLAITEQALRLIKNFPNGYDIYIIYVPKITQSIRILIEEEGMIDKITLKEFVWQFLPLEPDLLSLELPFYYKELVCKKDFSFLSSLAKNFFNVQCLYGNIANKVGIGMKSSAILKQLEVLESKNDAQRKDGDIGHLVVVDRDVDFVACLLSPVTYEALLDEVFGINCGIVDIGQVDNQQNAKLELSSKDKVFENIRNKHFATIFEYLSTSAKEIKKSQSMASSMNVTEMKDFVQDKLKGLQQQNRAINFHISAGEKITKAKGNFYENQLALEEYLIEGKGLKESMLYLERCLSTLQPIDITLRLICLMSCCLDGFGSLDYGKITKMVCDTYGFEHLATLSNLMDIGLIKQRSSQQSTDSISFRNFAQKLDLLPKDKKNSLDPSDAYSNVYIPVIHQVVKLMLENPNLLREYIRAKYIPSSYINCQAKPSSNTVLIFFVGGYTMAETSAIKALQAKSSYRFLIGGTSNITGKTLITSVV